MKKEFDVIGLGVSTVDILSVIDHFPDKEEVQKSIDSAIEGGGPVATAIIALARLGANVMMIDSIGDDWRGKLIYEEYQRENVDSKFIFVKNGFTSSSATVLIRKKDGARTIVYSPGNAPEVSKEKITKELISKTKYIHVNGRHLDACLHACSIAKICGTKISFDGGSHRFRDELKNIIPLTDICVVAKEFAFSYSKNNSIYEAGKIFLNEGPETVIITDGLNGSFLFTKEINGYHQKAFIAEKTFDTTGCGDSYHGGILFSLCKGYDLVQSMKIASAVAAINSTKLGGRSALPDLNTALSFLEKQ